MNEFEKASSPPFFVWCCWIHLNTLKNVSKYKEMVYISKYFSSWKKIWSKCIFFYFLWCYYVTFLFYISVLFLMSFFLIERDSMFTHRNWLGVERIESVTSSGVYYLLTKIWRVWNRSVMKNQTILKLPQTFNWLENNLGETLFYVYIQRPNGSSILLVNNNVKQNSERKLEGLILADTLFDFSFPLWIVRPCVPIESCRYNR